MSLNGIGSLPPGVVGAPPANRSTPATPADRNRTSGDAGVPAPAAPAHTQAGRAAAAANGRDLLSSQAPSGTDPELWKILTTEERQHFARAGARGPLTYGYLARAQAPQSEPVSRGVRLDLKA